MTDGEFIWRHDAQLVEVVGSGGVSLHDHQHVATRLTMDSLDAGLCPLVVSPTGTGKTVIACELIRLWLQRPAARVLFVAHRTEILDQATSMLARFGIRSAIEQADRKADQHARVVVASVQTLSRGGEARRPAGGGFDLLVVDEAHHVAADSYQSVVRRYGPRVVGFTATADRLDGKGLGGTFNDVPFEMHLPEAVTRGLVVPIMQRSIVVDSIDVSRVSTQVGDLDTGELERVLVKVESLQGVAVPMLEQMGNRRTLAFCASVAHAEALVGVINRMRPGTARYMSATTKPRERARVLAEFEAGAFQVLANCDLFTEGFDSPGVACVAMARPTKSRAFYQQAIGRGTRLNPGKRNLLVLDFCGNAGRHQLITAVDLFTSDDDVKSAVVGEPDPERSIDERIALARARICSSDVVRNYRTIEVGGFVGRGVCVACGAMTPTSPNGKPHKTCQSHRCKYKWTQMKSRLVSRPASVDAQPCRYCDGLTSSRWGLKRGGSARPTCELCLSLGVAGRVAHVGSPATKRGCSWCRKEFAWFPRASAERKTAHCSRECMIAAAKDREVK